MFHRYFISWNRCRNETDTEAIQRSSHLRLAQRMQIGGLCSSLPYVALSITIHPIASNIHLSLGRGNNVGLVTL